MPLATKILRTATKWFATSQNEMHFFFIYSLILHYVMPLNHN